MTYSVMRSRSHESESHASPTPLSPKEAAEAGMGYDGQYSGGGKADLIRANKGGALHSRIIQLEATSAGHLAGQP